MSNEFDPWEPQLPPDDFVDKVMAGDAARRASEARRRWLLGSLALGSVAAAAAVALLWRRPPSGEFLAHERREIVLDRAVVVLEPGARVLYRGLEVQQLQGEVFYRVDKGAPYRVVTPAGEVSVGGTCFRVRIHGTDDAPPRETGKDEGSMGNLQKIGAGAFAGVLLTVGVYEGKVKVSSAGQTHTLKAGESITAGPGAAAAPQRDAPDPAAAPTAAAAPSDPERAYEEANRALVENVQALHRKVAAAEEQKKKLERELKEAQEAVAAAAQGAPVKPKKHEFDLSQEDWKQLAENGTVKFRVPCFRKPDWQPSNDSLQTLGLAPQDGAMLKETYKKSNERMWSTIRPLCSAAIGNEAVVDKIGPDTCIHLVVDVARDKDRESYAEAMRQVGEIRAGLRPAPAAGEPQHPVLQVFMALTGEMGAFEADLAQQIGPEEARRLSFSEGLCAGSSTFGGPGPRKK